MHGPTRQQMDATFDRMGDPDGNFVDDFQGPGFHTRVFELCCFAYFESTGWTVDRSQGRPDFLIEKAGMRVAVEAVTTGPRTGRETDIAVMAIRDTPFAETVAKCNGELPIRLGSTLRRKLAKGYTRDPRCAGLPFVLMVALLHEPGSSTYNDESVARFLYGIERFPDWVERNGVLVRQAPVHAHTFDGKTIPSNFFATPEASELDAVLWCNMLTISRFTRMDGEENGLPPGIRGTVRGWYSESDGINAARFAYELGDGRTPRETWDRGVSLLMNPRTRHAAAAATLDATSVFELVGGQLVRRVRGFHPLISFTQFDGPPPAK